MRESRPRLLDDDLILVFFWYVGFQSCPSILADPPQPFLAVSYKPGVRHQQAPLIRVRDVRDFVVYSTAD